MLIFGIFALFSVFSVSAANSSSFLKNTKRPELFERTDFNVPTFKIYLPENELAVFYEECEKGYGMGGGGGGMPPPGMEGMDPSMMPPPPPPPSDGSISRIPPAGNPGTTVEADSFKTKNATMTAFIDGEELEFEKVTFGIGGSTSLSFKKQGFNIKIRGKKELLGRTQIRLRSDAREPTFLRTKVMCDIQSVLGLTTINANHARLYINDKFMGLYVMMDAFKLSWAEIEFGDVDSTTLIQCKDLNNDLSVELSTIGCINENEDVTDHTEWANLLLTLNKATCADDIKDIFDIDSFLYYIALEYLSASYDHFLLYGHNFYLYRPYNEAKWKFLLYDFDADLGQLEPNHLGLANENVTSFEPLVQFSFQDWRLERHLVTILIEQDPTDFNRVMTDIVTRAFNPAALFPHIDALKNYIKPFVEEDKTPLEDGNLPGRLNTDGEYDYTLLEWDAGVEFTFVPTAVRGIGGQASWPVFGLKRFILERYRYLCNEYQIQCDPYYLNGGEFTFTEVELPERETGSVMPPMPTESGMPPMPTGSVMPPKPTDATTEVPIETPTTTITTTATTTTIVEPTTTVVTDCWVYSLGYPCCDEGNTRVYATDSDGEWGYDFVNGEWCGITKIKDIVPDEICWSESLGYSCCKGCTIYAIDLDGEWGYENNEWCGIQSYCKSAFSFF